MKYDIFISYKRKSLATANNLYYRLTTRGYLTFFDLEEMRKDNFNTQLLNYIENAKDVFVILEEGSLDACKIGNWEEDWFCREIAHAIKMKKNIIPILLDNYKMPNQEFFPEALKELSLKNAPEFSFSYFEEYINKLIEKDYLTSEAQVRNQITSIFKFYSNENCQIFKDGKLVCSLNGMADEPFYLPVSRKGDYRFKVVNTLTNNYKIINEKIADDEEKVVEISWSNNLIRKRWKLIGLCLLFISSSLGLIYYNGHSFNSLQVIPIINDTICSPVDLGLPSGTLWADRNLGSKNEHDNGFLYIWGGIKPAKLQELTAQIELKNIIRTSYDAASISLGDEWGLPSEKQIAELIATCKWDWETNKGNNGYRVTGPNGKSIFLPAVGCILGNEIKYVGQFGYYWSGESHTANQSFARELIIGIGQINIESGRKNVARSIRAVYKK